MVTSKKVLLVTGPGGSGKSTLAEYAAAQLGWQLFEEDRYWVKHGWSGIRTDEQEQTVQREVVEDIHRALAEKDGIVLEFILYKNAPNPLTNYIDYFEKSGVPHAVIALKPTADEIMRRLKKRGRENDLSNIESRRADAEHQLRCLEEYEVASWVVDSTSKSVEDLFQECLSRLGMPQDSNV